MRFVQTFDPTAAASGTINIGTGDPGQKVLIYNESAVTIALNFENGYTAYVHAWEANYWTIQIPTYEIEWSAVRNLVGAGQAPASYVDVFVYGAEERVEGTYPVQLARLVSTGNIVAVASTGTNLINDGNAANSQIIEATQAGASGSNVNIDNSGNLALRQYAAATLTTLLQVIAGAAGGASNVKLSDAAHQCEVLGNLLCDLNLAVTGTATFSSVPTFSSGLGAITTTKTNFTTGSLTQIAVGSGTTSSGGSVTYTHGLSVTPDIVLVISTGSPTSFAVTGLGATTCTVTSSNILTPFKAIAIKL